MLSDFVAEIQEYEDTIKDEMFDTLSIRQIKLDDVCITMSLGTILDNPKLSLDFREYSYPFQATLIIDYIESHHLHEILVFLESIIGTGYIRWKGERIKALDTIISAVKEILNFD